MKVIKNEWLKSKSLLRFSLENELRRKAFHLAGLCLPLSYMVADRHVIVLSLSVLTFCCLVTESIRLRFPCVNQQFVRIFARMLRPNEPHQLTGLSYYLIGTLLTVLLFEKIVAIPAISFMIVGDFFAAIVGVSWGRTRVFQKTLEGSLACFVSCCLVGWIWFAIRLDWPLNLTLTVTGAVTATVMEMLPTGIDDNLTVPLISGVAMKIVAAFQS